MSEQYWEKFWQEHARASKDSHAQYQVLRTLNKQPIPEKIFERIVRQIERALKVERGDVLLDLCCGNGVITTRLAPKCKAAVGIDLAKDMLAKIDTKKHRNITLRGENVAEAALPENTFNKVLIYAGIQYFSEQQVVQLFEKVSKSLLPSGVFYIGDIPDADRIWNFFNSSERENVYFDSVKNAKPIVGTWLRQEWLTKLGKHAGFASVKVVAQPKGFPYAHYRFDMILRKPAARKETKRHV